MVQFDKVRTVSSGGGVTWDVAAIVFDVHLMQTSFGRGVFHSNGAILVVGDVRTGGSTRGHPHFTCRITNVGWPPPPLWFWYSSGIFNQYMQKKTSICLSFFVQNITEITLSKVVSKLNIQRNYSPANLDMTPSKNGKSNTSIWETLKQTLNWIISCSIQTNNNCVTLK